MKYNIDDYVNTPYGNVPIIGTDGINQYIILINNGCGWKRALYILLNVILMKKLTHFNVFIVIKNLLI